MIGVRLLSGAALLAVAIGAGPSGFGPARAAAQDNYVTECISGERVMGVNRPGELVPTTVVGPAGEGKCMVLLDDLVFLGAVEAPLDSLLRQPTPEGPDQRAIEIGSIDRDLDENEWAQLRSIAEASSGNARIFASRFALTVHDFTILARICNPDRENYLCKLANEQFFADVAANNRLIDERNALAAAEERSSSSEPINSGYYQSGQYSRDVAASQGRATSSSSSAAGSPVAVQSESDIRRDQERCRTGAGAC